MSCNAYWSIEKRYKDFRVLEECNSGFSILKDLLTCHNETFTSSWTLVFFFSSREKGGRVWRTKTNCCSWKWVAFHVESSLTQVSSAETLNLRVEIWIWYGYLRARLLSTCTYEELHIVLQKFIFKKIFWRGQSEKLNPFPTPNCTYICASLHHVCSLVRRKMFSLLAQRHSFPRRCKWIAQFISCSD